MGAESSGGRIEVALDESGEVAGGCAAGPFGFDPIGAPVAGAYRPCGAWPGGTCPGPTCHGFCCGVPGAADSGGIWFQAGAEESAGGWAGGPFGSDPIGASVTGAS
ncbi:hypothetical protein [Nocardia sp.]|uniref:hypothetical protein n=1 Tax=Nocardia sp. TaxID=1821 RepID=UPI00260DC2E9|nr:hypothetical protein [Nocardia sp.]